jgi:hypothetical protein
MKRIWFYFLTLFLSINSFAQEVLKQDNLLAWCIVPFDSNERGPEDRVQMLKDLDFKGYVYDWRSKHLETFEQEIKAAKANDIAIEGVWMWIDDKTDKVGELSQDNLKVLEILRKTGLKTTIWLGFNYNFFNDLSHREKVMKGASFINFLNDSLQPLGCNIALYNHGDWFGEPENQMEIIEASSLDNVSIVYSFHHGHHQVNRFHSMLQNMLPYLCTINLDGMDLQKGQILTIGEGKYEKEMIAMIIESGFKGKIGIIGHKDEDVKNVLKANLEGLEKLKSEL